MQCLEITITHVNMQNSRVVYWKILRERLQEVFILPFGEGKNHIVNWGAVLEVSLRGIIRITEIRTRARLTDIARILA